MSEVGCRWNGVSISVGFEATTRDEYLAHLEKLQAFVDLVWPPAAEQSEMAASTISEDNVEQVAAFAKGWATDRRRPIVRKSWADMTPEERRVYRLENGLS